MPQVWDLSRWVRNDDGTYSRRRGVFAASNGDESEVNITSAAAELAEELGVDVNTIEGSGAEGRITKGDVEAAAESK